VKRAALCLAMVVVGLDGLGGLVSLAHAQGASPAAPGAAPPAAGSLQAGQLSKLPRQIRFVEADYPAEAITRGLEADVILSIDIGADGRVTTAAVTEPSAYAGLGFEEAATAAALQFQFEPAEVAGQPTAVQLSYRYKFRLKAKAPAPAAGALAPGAPAAGAGAGGGPGAGATPARPPAPPPMNLGGALRERGTRLPLPGLVVTVFQEDGGGGKPVGYEATSDAAGAFRFFGLPAGTWQVHIESAGHLPFRTSEEIHAGQATQVTYYLERGDYNPFDVTVTAQRPRKEVSRTVLSATEIDKVPGTMGDPLAVVQNFAGVARSPFLSGQVIVRGAAPEDSRVFVDGAEVPLIYHFGGLRSVLPLQMLDSLEFYPGNFAPAYGRASGGVVDARTKRLAPKRFGGSVDVSLMDAGLYLEIPLGDEASVALAGRRSYIGTVIAAAIPDDVGISYTVAPRYYDYQLLASYRPAPAHDVRAFLFASDDKLELLFKNPADLDSQLAGDTFSSSEAFQRALLSYRFVPGPSFENELRLSYGRDQENDFFGQLAVDVDTDTFQARDNVRHRFTDWLSLSYGADLLVTRVGGFVRAPALPKEGEPQTFDLTKIRSTRFTETEWAPAGFVEGELELFDRWLLLPGLRVDHFGRNGETVLQPRFTTRLELAESVTAKGGVGLYVQSATVDETNVVFGNPDLEAERALHYSVGAEYRPLPHLTLDATLFYKDLRHLVSRTDRLVSDGGMARPLNYDNGGRGKVYGAEVQLRQDLGSKVTGWLAYTVSRSLRQDSGDAEERLFDYDQTHILTAVASYAFARTWLIGGRFRLVSGNPRTPIEGAVFNTNTDRYEPRYGRANTQRNQPFHQLDLRIEKRWVYEQWMLNAYLDVQNVYNRRNPEGLIYNYDYRETTVQQGLPLLPILGLRAEF
jgi:TonB family protein